MSVGENSKITNYLNNICSFIKYKEPHNEIKKELISHIDDITDDYIEKGYAEEEAINKAIIHMGDAEEVGKQLNLAHKGNPDWITVILTLLLVNIGIVLTVIMQSTGLVEGSVYKVFNSVIYAVVGMVLIVLLYYFDYRKLEKYSKYIFIFGIVLYCGMLFIRNITCRGSFSLRIYRISYCLFDTCPLIFIIGLAGIFNNFNWNKPINVVKALLLLIGPMFLMIMTPNLIACIMYFIAYMVVAIKSGARIKYIMSIIMINICVARHFIMNSIYIRRRLFGFLDPGSLEINNKIYNIIHSAGLFGNGISMPKDMMPGVELEFIFNYIIYAFGWLGATILVVLFIVYIVRILYITREVRNSYGKLLIYGLVSMFILNVELNILMNINLMPTLGLTLPFISYGGMSCLPNMIYIGLILSVYRRRSLDVISKITA